MNKSELIDKIAGKTELTKKDTGLFVNSLTEAITEELVKGEKVQLVGFGTFETRDRKERIGRNPRNPQEKIKIPKSRAVVFKSGKTLKDAVNNK